jgi:serine/threonine protein kinase
MSQIHARNVIHLLLEASNVLLDEKNELPITGCRWVELTSEPTVRRQPDWRDRVSPALCAPQLFSERGFDHKVDVFAYAMLLSGIFTGRPVLGSGKFRSTAALSMLIVNEDRLARVTEIPPAFWELIEACRAHERTDRPSCVEITRILLRMRTFG